MQTFIHSVGNVRVSLVVVSILVFDVSGCLPVHRPEPFDLQSGSGFRIESDFNGMGFDAPTSRTS